MMSMHSSTHSSQMKTVGPAISLRTSCWLLPQNEQYSVFFESLPLDLLIGPPLGRAPYSSSRFRHPPVTVLTHPPGIPCKFRAPATLSQKKPQDHLSMVADG